MIVLCWLVPIIIVTSLAGFLLGKSYMQSAEQEVNDSAEYALRQVQLQLEGAIWDSKSISYDGTVRSVYRLYQEDGDQVETYRIVNEYLTQKFSRSPQYKAIFLNFWDAEIGADVYILNGSVKGFELMQECKDISPGILQIMKDEDTDIRFLTMNGNLYLARNLLDSHFNSYATIVMLLDPQVVFESLNGLRRVQDALVQIDDIAFCVDCDGMVESQGKIEPEQYDVSYCSEANGHTFSFLANLSEYNLFEENPWILWLGAAVSLMVLPLLLVFIALFHRHVTRPMETLVQAHQIVQTGKRGYEIEGESPNLEFAKLFSHFNAMSKDLEDQFERSYLEQQASQRAQIKALQSQINPHFLNNTLEIINWEARLAGNDRISAMIEALSTMLGAALDRKGRSEIPLKEELGYVDAYLYIIHQRIGEKFHVHKEIDSNTLQQMVPRLILQPIAENAIEHDIAPHHGGNLWVRARQQDQQMLLEVEHDGTLTDDDLENVAQLLSDDSHGPRVGLQNVHQRLKLIYGDRASLQIQQTDHGTILARIRFPAEAECEKERNLQ